MRAHYIRWAAPYATPLPWTDQGVFRLALRKLSRQDIAQYVALLVGVGLLVSSLNGASHATIVSYDDETTFFADADIESTEDFDSFASGTALGFGTAQVDAIIYTCSNPAQEWRLERIYLRQVSSPNALVPEGSPRFLARNWETFG